MDWFRRQDKGTKFFLGCSALWALFVVGVITMVIVSGAGARMLTSARSATGSPGFLCPEPKPRSTDVSLSGDGRVYFVPIDDDEYLPIEELVFHYRQKYRLYVTVLPMVPVRPELFHPDRDQVFDEDLRDLVARSYPALASDRQAVLIGITPIDMYPRRPDWEFVLSSRWAFLGESRERLAVVSAARMDPEFFGMPSNPELLETRLRKMVTRNIGIMYYHLPQTSDPSSVLYDSIGGVPALDCVGEDF